MGCLKGFILDSFEDFKVISNLISFAADVHLDQQKVVATGGGRSGCWLHSGPGNSAGHLFGDGENMTRNQWLSVTSNVRGSKGHFA